MSEALDAIRQASDLLAAVARIDRSFLSDNELCLLATAEEHAAHLVSASQVQSAAEIDDRSRTELGEAGLSMRNSFRRAVPFLEQLTRASQSDLAGRVRLGHAIRPRTALTGEILPPTHPFVAEGVKSGRVAPEDAAIIIRCLGQAANGENATLERMDAAEQALAELAATGFSDVLRMAARGWRDALDPDGVEPRYEEIVGLRSLSKGREHNGITTWSLKTDPRATALIDAVLDESTAPGAIPRFQSEEDRRAVSVLDESGAEVQVLADHRNRGQKQLDTLVGVLTAGLRASHDAEPSMRATGTVIATVTLAELEAGVGTAWLAGANEPIPISALEQLICDGGVRVVVLGKNAEPLYETILGRYFNQKQRRAMLIRDGDECVGPGCHNPAAWADAHHVVFHESGGPTALANGVLLCGNCHTALHLGAFEIKMVAGVPFTRLSVQAGDDSAWRRAGTRRHLAQAA